MRYILIDPSTKTITVEEAEGVKSLKNVPFFGLALMNQDTGKSRQLIGGHGWPGNVDNKHFESVVCNDGHGVIETIRMGANALLVDENARMSNELPAAFSIDYKTIYGRAALLATDGDNITACRRTLEDVVAHVKFDGVETETVTDSMDRVFRKSAITDPTAFLPILVNALRRGEVVNQTGLDLPDPKLLSVPSYIFQHQDITALLGSVNQKTLAGIHTEFNDLAPPDIWFPEDAFVFITQKAVDLDDAGCVFFCRKAEDGDSLIVTKFTVSGNAWYTSHLVCASGGWHGQDTEGKDALSVGSEMPHSMAILAAMLRILAEPRTVKTVSDLNYRAKKWNAKEGKEKPLAASTLITIDKNRPIIVRPHYQPPADGKGTGTPKTPHPVQAAWRHFPRETFDCAHEWQEVDETHGFCPLCERKRTMVPAYTTGGLDRSALTYFVKARKIT